MNGPSELGEDLVHSILAVRPDVGSVFEAVSFRPQYRLFPARLTLGLQSGERTTEVLKVSNGSESLTIEAEVLKALRDVGLAVPRVTSPVFAFRKDGIPHWGMLLEELDARALDWLGLNELRASRHSIATLLPRRTLEGELASIRLGAANWLTVPFFGEALAILEDLLPQITVPLTFSNGDYNPLNFLAKNDELVGWIDFEHACFEDPYIGFAKFLLWADDDYGWGTGVQCGLVERYLFGQNVKPSDFSARVVLRGLHDLLSDTPDTAPQPMVAVIKTHLTKLQHAR